MTIDPFDRTPPQDLAAERSLLASLILDPRNVDQVTRLVSSVEFHDADNGRLFDALVSIHEARLPIGDMAVLRSELGKLGLDQWTPAELGGLVTSSTGNHAGYYAGRVRECSRKRKYLDIAAQLAGRAFDCDADDISSWLAVQLDGVSGDRGADVHTVGEIARGVLDDLDDNGTAGRGLMTGLFAIDEAVGCLMPGEMVVLAARPGLGKTSLAMQIATHNAERDRSVLFVSLEMSDRELIQRMICSRSGINQRRIRTGSLNGDDKRSMIAATSEISEVPLRIWSPASATIQDIRATARLEQKTAGLSLLVVDYLQLVQPPRSDERKTATEQVTNISNAIKRLAKELSVPVLVLAQLNRESEKTR